MDWQINGDVWVEHDDNGFAQQLRHIQSPFFVSGVTSPYRLAVAYLRRTRDELGLTDEQIEHLDDTIPPNPTVKPDGSMCDTPGPQLRWWRYRAIRNETFVVIIQQTNQVPLRLDFGNIHLTSLVLNVFGSALRLVMHRQADRTLVVTGVTSTLQHTFDFTHAEMLADTSPPLAASGRPARGKRAGKARPKPAEAAQSVTPQLTRELLLQALEYLGLPSAPVPAEVSLGIYRYRPDEDGEPQASGALGLPRQRKRKREEVVPNSDYAVAIIRHLPFGYDDDFRVGLDSPPVDIVTRLPDFSVIAAVPLLAGARATAAAPRLIEGMVFPTDPISARGYDIADNPPRRDRTLRPNRPSSELNAVRESVKLHRLDPPNGTPRRQKLRGSNVAVVEPGEVAIGSVQIEPPTRPPGRDFDYDSRTNDFAAVNAYYHLDSMLHRLQLFGMPFATYAPTFNPRIDVIHRAAIRPGPGGDGRCINAQVRIRPGVSNGTGGSGVDPTLHTLEFRFALADLPPAPEINPLGIACDVRWVWHEFGHALIAGATGDLELPFAHSVGDGLAAINCDPDLVLARPVWAPWNLRGVTFPWVTLPNRRHDREAAQGWTWNGRLGQVAGYRHDHGDVAGYHREQVLSSTLFRLYRAIGGDAARANGAPEVDRRRRAADMATYLIVRALASLGPASTTPASDASVFASAMMDADRGTPIFDYPGLPPDHVSQRRVGGRLHKVIRWAFEKQGLYARDDATAHGAGAPEPVDVYIDDGRSGEYQFTDDWTATRQALWLRRMPDGGQTHQGPRKNQDNYIYVRVWNRGYDVAHAAQARVRVAPASAGLGWPDAARWTELPAAPSAPTTGDVGANDQIVLGPFKWRPTRRGDYTILVELDVMGDRSNINVSTGLPCALPTAEVTPLRRLVPYDNNLGATTWTVP